MAAAGTASFVLDLTKMFAADRESTESKLFKALPKLVQAELKAYEISKISDQAVVLTNWLNDNYPSIHAFFATEDDSARERLKEQMQNKMAEISSSIGPSSPIENDIQYLIDNVNKGVVLPLFIMLTTGYLSLLYVKMMVDGCFHSDLSNWMAVLSGHLDRFLTAGKNLLNKADTEISERLKCVGDPAHGSSTRRSVIKGEVLDYTTTFWHFVDSDPSTMVDASYNDTTETHGCKSSCVEHPIIVRSVHDRYKESLRRHLVGQYFGAITADKPDPRQVVVSLFNEWQKELDDLKTAQQKV